MFRREWWLTQVWNVVVGAVVAIVILIVYSVMQFIHFWFIVTALNAATGWLPRALLIVVTLWVLGVVAKYFFGSSGSSSEDEG